jgi:hypothetical protein
VGRWHQLFLLVAAALGLAGCLLLSDPVNKAPTVTVSYQGLPIYRGQTVEFTATVKDDRDAPSDLELRWDVLSPKDGDPKTGSDGSCLTIGAADWRKGIVPSRLDQPFSYKFDDVLAAKCVCAEVTDSKGAKAYACSQPIKPSNPTPVPVITDESGALSGDTRRLCSQIRLFGENKADLPTSDPLSFKWTMQYSGTDAAGRSVQLSACPDDKTGAHQCMYAAAPGDYTVSLTIDDTIDPTQKTSGKSADYVIHVDLDRPPCLRRTEPDIYAHWILPSSSYTFKALSVDDDCEPYPQVSGSRGPTQFVWSVLDTTNGGTAGWVRQTESSDSFTISKSKFPNARPGDTIRVRLEVRDTPVQQSYQTGGKVCDEIDQCCGPQGCGANECVRWTTWTVQFQP